MNDKVFFLSPKICALIYRIIGLIILWILWMKTDSGLSGLIAILFIMILMLVRWRFKNLKWTLIFDKCIYLLTSMFWGNAAYGLMISTFDSVYYKISWLTLLSVMYAAFYKQDYILLIIIINSLFCGFILKEWQRQNDDNITKIDFRNKKLYELEALKNDLLIANTQIARMSEISERNRISREIHDNAGHDIIAAYMSLQVIEDLISNEDSSAKEMFSESMKRLDMGITKIRDTVHNLSPLTSIGVDYIKDLCDKFPLCPVNIEIYGDTSKIPIYLWSIIEPCVKESLTNISKHSNAKNVRVTLDITPYIVRLSIENDGVKEKTSARGIGIKNLIQRASAVGGNISIDVSNIFRLVCVLPMG